MSIIITIEADGTIEAVHNSGRTLWSRNIAVDEWGDADVPADLALSEAIKSFLDEVDEE